MFGRPNDVIFAGQPAEMADAENAIRLEKPFDFLDRPVFIEVQPRLARRNRIERCGVEAGVLRRSHPKISRKAKRLSAVPGFKNLSCRYIHAGDIATLLSEARGNPRLYPDRECADWLGPLRLQRVRQRSDPDKLGRHAE